jgi:hypothetical protein
MRLRACLAAFSMRLAHHTGQALGIAQNRHRAHARGVHANPPDSHRPLSLFEHDLTKRYPIHARRQLPLIGPGEREQVAHQSLHPAHLRKLAGEGILQPSAVIRVRLLDLDLRPQGGDRAPQLMGGVRDETPLPIRSVLKPVEHLVHRACKAADLVIHGRLGDALVQSAGADRGDLGPDGLDRPERPPDDPPAGSRDDQ